MVEQFRLTCGAGITVEIINYGGIITRLEVPDVTGQLADVVLGKESLEDYLAGHPYFGAIVGRVAGRITDGKFSIAGNEYQLVTNNGSNHLHGGEQGLDKRVWSAEALEGTDGLPSLRLGYFSAAGEEGYPGDLKIFVTYTLRDNGELVIDYQAESDQPTPVSLTNHSYFNLSGHNSGNCLDQRLKIYADTYVPADEEMTLLGRIAPVEVNINDFREFKRLGDMLPGMHLGHGDNYLINGGGKGQLVPAAELQDPASGRCLRVSTTCGSMQLYVSSMLGDGTGGKDHVVYNRHQAVCLECQGYPDGANSPEIEDIILCPGAQYQQQTVYAFSTVNA